jgi:hypothetical protein
VCVCRVGCVRLLIERGLREEREAVLGMAVIWRGGVVAGERGVGESASGVQSP